MASCKYLMISSQWCSIIYLLPPSSTTCLSQKYKSWQYRHKPQTPAITYATVNKAVSACSVSMYSQSEGSTEIRNTRSTETCSHARKVLKHIMEDSLIHIFLNQDNIKNAQKKNIYLTKKDFLVPSRSKYLMI